MDLSETTACAGPGRASPRVREAWGRASGSARSGGVRTPNCGDGRCRIRRRACLQVEQDQGEATRGITAARGRRIKTLTCGWRRGGLEVSASWESGFSESRGLLYQTQSTMKGTSPARQEGREEGTSAPQEKKWRRAFLGLALAGGPSLPTRQSRERGRTGAVDSRDRRLQRGRRVRREVRRFLRGCSDEDEFRNLTKSGGSFARTRGITHKSCVCSVTASS